MAKLNDLDVEFIRLAKEIGIPTIKLALLFNVCWTTINDVWLKKYWFHI